MTGHADLILVNADALTMDPRRPKVQAVAIAGNRILAVGDRDAISMKQTRHTRWIDCRGLPLIPGLNDAHCHVLATASSLSALDCSPRAVTTIRELLNDIRNRARDLPPGAWIRGNGMDREAFPEKRFPTRGEIDSAAPDHPVRLELSGGHGCVLNSQALRFAGIEVDTPDPMEGVIDRDADTGEPTGLLLDMGAYLRQKLGHTRSADDLVTSVALLNEKLLGCGVTSVQDAGPHNGPRQWETFTSLKGEGVFTPRVTMMAGAQALNELTELGLSWNSGDQDIRLGHAKIMLGLTTGGLYPAPEDLAQLAQSALDAGFPFAIHVIEHEALAAVLDLPQLGQAPAQIPAEESSRWPRRARPSNRIEHCAECPPDLMQELVRARPTVVTQPGFIYWRGDNYLDRVESWLLPHLYEVNSMLDNGVPLAFSSDSPTIDSSPWPGIFSAVSRRTIGGRRLPSYPGHFGDGETRPERMTLEQALCAYTWGGARAEGMEQSKGMIRPGMLADLALLGHPIDQDQPDSIIQARSCLTIVDGKVVWRDGTV